MARHTWSYHKTREKAEASLEDDFATGDVVAGERPMIETRRHPSGEKYYIVTLDDNLS